ncbi:VOC family protein [Sulfitobacter mediterraneus]|uniref:VOC family protein n=1 Tax=Sulfitobacter mediterraneus TaxID=83219 RepID=UPI00193423E5|nr:VOC family protein [Sulfitobacter mediterraneus]MBM1310813.1 VOC family protein [Sulfitobacter mediterraneus]MBM1314697.1 VOC family protein [Sulfitobacter mediterraneus]MBM1323057.1 VOC family protein [Sulfitobacter mediterraneus]MBM1326969.1 VOC family protein [Sulfitobacter mediterraneus]MBM1398315.1 VOC family protein [Sulfitobacter mediterraneus]
MDQRISLITLGAQDPAALAVFYDALGWSREDSPDGVIAYDLIGQTLGIYPLEKLAEDIGLLPEELGRGASTFSYNVPSKEDVAPLLAAAEAAGGRILKPAHDIFWGGHIGYFADPEGHIWEVAHNPFSALGPKGEFRWNGYG